MNVDANGPLMPEGSALWRRLDTPGHDACRLACETAGSRLLGSAVFFRDGAPAVLAYVVTCGSDWVSRKARISGWTGDGVVSVNVARDERGAWTLDRRVAPAVAGCLDLDLGFTPATNLLPLRRLSLQVGESAEITSAWLDVDAGMLEPLVQRYERRTDDAYWYEAPRFGYQGLLRVAPSGFVRDYPTLWRMEP